MPTALNNYRTLSSPTRYFSLWIIIGWGIVLFLLKNRIGLIFTHIPIDYNEGWNAYWAERAIGLVQAPLYPNPQNSLIFNNYPPLSFYIVGWIGYFLGDMVFAGRIVALCAWLLTGYFIFRLIQKAGGDKISAHSGSLLFLIYSSYFFRDYIAMDDPQWLGHAFMLGGLMFLLPASQLSPLRVVIAAALFIIGGLVKHNLLALPFAVTCWLFLRDKKLALLWVTTGVVGILLSILCFITLYHNNFMLEDILHHKRVLELGRIHKAVGRLAIFLTLILVSSAFFHCKENRYRNRDNLQILFGIFTVLSLINAFIESLGDGVSYNAFFESLVALSITVGLALSLYIQSPTAFYKLILLTLLPVIIMIPSYLPGILKEEHLIKAESPQWNALITRLKEKRTPVICNIAEICYWAGKSYQLDFFNFQQAMRRGASSLPLEQKLTASPHVSIVDIKLPLKAKRKAPPRPIWQIILAHPHKTEKLSPDVTVITL
ncbi:ArnT family glycosyltransferase [Zymomonas mobilis]|uniref:Glycosyltransferase RgtA/B/C/D-like domain-containing protein n=1 Tax=Zymomonas mobilis subsp. pomaceae (strain ATCC 29192 / DSM 22645 / JCM 10191 / CCUG 17912 / NBRC 13757 / NCIMB 11200 / NRRL B-4491 / Barker I) TaxID=579138 RepID=F8EUT0_ZYMMT|nr:hypothetical protein [Zymomonas mobilis]AEI38226.1 hypothetical protein Zymop_1336 [Zymomonas mobilis subsp. pomaceae ATCC 29192]MDX5947916.1 hypothetical protein [Zymomonas mobilis subsp. pomaceae]GEB89977.1 hypothetical protein ZMO02_16140 [Zymomonas mobilis subsp. pomaceae]